jgi:hypothetical protein
MKRQKKILFKIIFLLVVFFSYGINAHSDFDRQLFAIDLSTENNNVEDRFSSNNNSMNEDQIDTLDKFKLTGEPISQKLISQNFSLVYNFCLSIWQPPKIF